jgi:hypothetical protein
MNAELLKQLSTALGAQIRAYHHVRENPRLRLVNLVGTRSTASPSLRPEVWDAGGTRPYQPHGERVAVRSGEGQYVRHFSLVVVRTRAHRTRNILTRPALAGKNSAREFQNPPGNRGRRRIHPIHLRAVL